MIEQYGLGVWCLYCAISQAIITIILLLSIGWFARSILRCAAPQQRQTPSAQLLAVSAGFNAQCFRASKLPAPFTLIKLK